MVPLLLFIGNKHFGISSSLQHICTAVFRPRARYFRYDWRDKAWNLYLAVGVILGAAIAVLFLDGDQAPGIGAEARSLFASWGLGEARSLLPPEIFALENIVTPAALTAVLFGGFLVGFGARYADGCTSGHAIMGLSLLNLGSLVAVIGFFIGGLIVSHTVVPLLMGML